MTKVVTIQDISCVGQCSLTVALPIISAFGIETAILPSAVLSTHTGGFTGFTFRDLTDDIMPIAEHWKKEKISFDAIYTGYIGNAKQMEYILYIFDNLLAKGGKIIVDPAMADYGKLYTGFDTNFVREMAKLCARADYVLPNLSEATFLLNEPFVASGYDEKYIEGICEKLHCLGAKNVVLTGVSFDADKVGVATYDGNRVEYYFKDREKRNSHGTGDIYASAFCGALMNGKTMYEAAALAADVVVESIRATADDPEHWYGVKFEKVIPFITRNI